MPTVQHCLSDTQHQHQLLTKIQKANAVMKIIVPMVQHCLSDTQHQHQQPTKIQKANAVMKLAWQIVGMAGGKANQQEDDITRA